MIVGKETFRRGRYVWKCHLTVKVSGSWFVMVSLFVKSIIKVETAHFVYVHVAGNAG